MAIEVIEGQKKIILVGSGIAGVISAVAYFKGHLHISSGILAGFLISLINYYLLNITVEKGVRFKKGLYQSLTVVSFFVRFTVLAYLIYLALLQFGQVFVFAGLVGMFILKILFFIAYVKVLVATKK